MADLSSIQTDSNYVNANAATKQAIFDKFSATDTNFTSANLDTQNAIRARFGLTAPVAPSEIPAPRPRGGVLFGALEAGANMATGLGATALGGLAGLAGSILPGEEGQGARYVQNVQKALTYEPRTQRGQQIADVAALPLELATQGAGRVGEFVGGNVGRTIGEAVPAVAATLLPVPKALKAGRTANVAAQNALAERANTIAAERSVKSYETAPMLEATKLAVDNGIAVNPATSNPTKGNRLRAVLTGSADTNAKIAQANEPRWTAKAVESMGLPRNTQLTTPDVYAAARALPEVAGPYEAVASIPVVDVPQATYTALDRLRAEPLYGDTGAAAAANKFVDKITADLDVGGTGNKLLKSIQQLRREAQNIYRADTAGHPLTPETRAQATAKMGAADALELAIEQSIPEAGARQAFRDARVKMKQTYDYESATNFATGRIDPQVLAQKLASGEPLSGKVRELAMIAANHPETSVLGANAGAKPRLTRSGLGATLGGLIGAAVVPGAGFIPGTIVGAGAGAISSGLGAKRMLTPEYQAKRAVPTDYRLPEPYTEIPRTNALVPYEPPVDVLPPEIRPNFTFGRPPAPPDIRPAMSMLEAPSPESTLNALRAEDVRRGRMSRVGGQAAEEAAAAEAAAARQPTGRGTNLVFDERGRLVPEPIAGEPLNLAPTSLESAVQKLSGSMVRGVREPQKFDLTATEKIAWSKVKANLADAVPGLNKLSDAEIAAKMNDRQWTANAVAGARAKAEALGRQEASLAEQLANRENLRMMAKEITAKNKELADIRADRERLSTFADGLDEAMRAARPTSTGGQGPKTREFNRNKLSPQENKNQLSK